jgi:nitrogen PTS system EIIA component
MNAKELLAPDHVIVGLRIGDKSQLLQELARRAAPAAKVEPDVLLKALQAREQLGSTGIGKGFAVPHARLNTLTQPFALFVRLARPIDFAAVDEKPVDIVVLLLSPEDDASRHLATLAALCRPARDPAFLQRLRQAADSGEVHRLLAAVTV